MKYTIYMFPTRDDDSEGFMASVPAIPELLIKGDSMEEAQANAKETIKLYLDYLKEQGQPIPVEKERPQLVSMEMEFAAP